MPQGILSEKVRQQIADSGKPLWGFFEDWVRSIGAISAKRGVELEIDRHRQFVSPATSPHNEAPYWDEYRIYSANDFPDGNALVTSASLDAFDGDANLLEANVMSWLSQTSGKPIPPIPGAPPPPASNHANESPIGPPMDGLPGYFHPTAWDTTPDGGIYEPNGKDGAKYRKVVKRYMFGGLSWWEQVR